MLLKSHNLIGLKIRYDATSSPMKLSFRTKEKAGQTLVSNISVWSFNSTNFSRTKPIHFSKKPRLL